MRQSNRISRRPAFRDPLPRISLFCEGKVTETEYFEALRADARGKIHIEVAEVDSSPKKLVVAAKAYRKFDAFDESTDQTWCIFDVDDHLDLADALRQAKDNAIPICVSNPCIELWGLLHFEDFSRYVYRRDLTPLLRNHIPNYEKKLELAHLMPNYEDAKRRAQVLDRVHERERDAWPANPSTNVWQLVDEILRLIEERT